VLSKYDFGKAWRPRLFVLHPGVGLLAYYKLRAAGVGGGGGGGLGGGGASAFGGEGTSVGGGGRGGNSSSEPAASAAPAPSPSDPDVAALLDGLRLEGEVSLIGAQVSVLEDQWRRRRRQQLQQKQQQGANSSSSSSFSTAATLLEPAGEVALQVAAFSASRTDRRKLYVHAGTRKIAVRAETAEDRWAWLDALAAAKAGLPPLASPGLRPTLSSAASSAAATAVAMIGLGGEGEGDGAQATRASAADDSANSDGAPTSSSSFSTARALRARLRELGASSAAAEEAARTLDDARRAASASAHAAVAAERRELLARVARLESDKRQLETALVVERELANSSGGGSSGGSGALSPLSSRSSFFPMPSPVSSSSLSPGGRLMGWARSGAAALLGGRGTSLASPSSSRQQQEQQSAVSAAGNLLARRRQRRRLRQQLRKQGAGGVSGATAAEAAAAAAAPSVAASSVTESTDDCFDEDESSTSEEEEEDEDEKEPSTSDEEQGRGKTKAAAPPLDSGSGDAFFDAEEQRTTSEEQQASTLSRPATPPWLEKARESKEKGLIPPYRRRTALPEPEQREASVSLWSIIRECVGKDLTRVCLPVYFNEPLSALQKIAEDMEYSELLDEAAALPAGSVERLLRVAAFAVSAYSGSGPSRTRKPFNPLLSETFELVRPDKGFRFLAEKVVHHPTVVAAAAEGRGWSFSGDADVRSKFWGRSIELTPAGLLTLRFHDGDGGDGEGNGGEEFSWKKVVTSISGLILGRLHVDHGGVMRVSSSTSGLTAVLRFKEPGLFSSSYSSSLASSSSAAARAGSKASDGGVVSNQAHEVRGHVEQNGARLASPLIVGSWSESLSAVYVGGESNNGNGNSSSSNNNAKKNPTSQNTSSSSSSTSTTKKHVLLWRCSPPPADPTRYCLTSFAISLNEITPEEEGKMAPTDSRLRPDQHCLELGVHDRANAEKQRLERKQRAARAAADRGEQIRPRWFERVNEGRAAGEAPMYRFTGEYWRCRERGEFPRCRDIFGEEEQEEEGEGEGKGKGSRGGSAAATPTSREALKATTPAATK